MAGFRLFALLPNEPVWVIMPPMEGTGKTDFSRRGDWWLPRYEHFFVGALIAFVLGNVTGFSLPFNPLTDWRVSLCLMLVLLGVLFASDSRRVLRTTMLWMFFLTGVLWFTLFSYFADKTDVISQLAPMDEARVAGIVTDHPNGNPHRAFMDVTAINDNTAYHGRILVTASQFTLPEDGMPVLLEGKLTLPRKALVPGEFNERAYLQTEHALAVLRDVNTMRVEAPVAVSRIGRLQMSSLRLLDSLRVRMAGVFSSVLPSPDAEVLGGIVLGSRAIPVDKVTKQQFVETGLIHILAASGMNVGIVAAFVFWLCGLFRLTQRWRIAIAMGAVGFYAVLTGLPPSIQRAATMLEMALLLKLLNKELSSLFLLCIAAAALVAIDPLLVGSLGFQFSVLTTFGLITMVAPLQEILGRYITRGLAGAILVPLVAQLWVLPLTLFHFNQFPAHSVLLNMLALFCVVPLTSIGFTAGAFSLLWKPLGQAVTWLAWPFVKGLIWLVQTGHAMTWAKMSLPSPEPWQLAGLYGLLVLLTLFFYQYSCWSRVRKAWMLLGLVLLLIFPPAMAKFRTKAASISIVPLSYRHAGFVLRETPNARPVVLLPAGIDYWEGRRMSDYLKHRNWKHIAVLATWGASAAEGVNAVVKNRKVDHRLQFSSERAGVQLASAGLALDQHEGLFRLKMGHDFCLMGQGHDHAKVPPSSCTFAYVEDESGYRLSPAGFFKPEQFYHLGVRQAETLALFEGE